MKRYILSFLSVTALAFTSFAQCGGTTVVPSVSITADHATVCQGTAVTFTATPINGGSAPTYQWKLGGVYIGGATNATYTSSNLQNADQISVTMISSDNCASPVVAVSNIFVITVTTLVTSAVNITALYTTICAGTSVTFEANFANGGPAPTFQWEINGQAVQGATNYTFTSSSLHNDDVISTILTSSSNCLTSPTAVSNGITMTVKSQVIPSVSITSNITGNTCEGNNLTYTATAINGGSAPLYEWFAGAVSQGPASNSNEFTLKGISPTNNAVSVKLTSSEACANPVTVTSNIITIPTDPAKVSAGKIGSDQTVCSGSSVTINELTAAQGTTNSLQHTWEYTQNLSGLWTSVPNEYNTSLTIPSLTTDMYYRRSVTDYGSTPPCNVALSNIVKITVAPMETMTVVLNNPGQVCAGTNLNFTVTANISTAGIPGALSYQWYLGTNPVGNNSSSYSYTPQSSDNGKTVKVIVASSGCNYGSVTSNIITLDVVSPAAPTVTITPSNNPSCTGAPLTFTATATAAGTSPTYQWYVNSAAASIGATNSTFTTTSLVNGDQVWVELTSNHGCMIGTNPFKSNTVSMVIASPIAAPVINEGDHSMCSPNAFYFTCSSISNVSYQWKHNGTNIAGATRATYEATETGNYTVEVSNGTCSPAESDPVTLTIINTPIANAGQDQYVLAGTEVTLNASGGELYSWTPTQGLNNFLISNPTVVISETIEYMVKVSDQSNTCSTTDAVKIYVTNVTPGSFSTFINGLNPIIPGLQNVSYGVPNQASFSYVWSVTGGTIVSGQNTNSVLVDWDPAPANATARTTASSYSISVTETNQAKQSKKTTLNIQQITTGVTKSLAQSGITLFPNPTAESFNIEMPESGVSVNYEIVDLTGVSVAQGNFISTGNAEKITTDFGAGIYQVILRYNNTVTCGRLSKVQ